MPSEPKRYSIPPAEEKKYFKSVEKSYTSTRSLTLYRQTDISLIRKGLAGPIQLRIHLQILFFEFIQRLQIQIDWDRQDPDSYINKFLTFYRSRRQRVNTKTIHWHL